MGAVVFRRGSTSCALPQAQPAEPPSSDPALLLLRALADPIRLQVVDALVQGERCVCELTAELALAQSKLSFHLKVLRQAGLISGRQEGRWMFYRLQPAALGPLRLRLDELALARCEAGMAVCTEP